MTTYLVPLICFLLGVIIAFIAFVMTNKADPANKTFEDLWTEKFNLLSARVSVLENKKMSKVEMIEITEATKLIMTEHQKIREQVSSSMLDFNTTVLRLISTFRPWAEVERKKKELSQ